MNSVQIDSAARRGPRPARPAHGRGLSASRAALLETLESQSEPLGLRAVVALTGLHANTVREHLDGLRHDGLVQRSPAPASGRGRPGWLYAATGRSPGDPRPEYAALAAALASVVARTSPDPAQDARDAGAEWGRRLAPPTRSPRSAHHLVSDLLDRMGFAPEPGAGAHEVRLTRCPLLEAARERPDVVCAVHQGMAEGVLAAQGHPSDGVQLVPFAEPGACLLRLPHHHERNTA